MFTTALIVLFTGERLIRGKDHIMSGIVLEIGVEERAALQAAAEDIGLALDYTGPQYRGALLCRLADIMHPLVCSYVEGPVDHVVPRVCVGAADSVRPGLITMDVTGSPLRLTYRLVGLLEAERAMSAAPLYRSEVSR
jgi:hypothetical protein